MTSPQIKWISSDDPPGAFPPLESATIEPDGLLAAGGDLSSERLLHAYSAGIFPWYDSGQPVLWWSPDPRCVLVPSELHVSRRLKRFLRSSELEVSFNRSFQAVIESCAEDRSYLPGTWISEEMIEAYCRLHQEGWAHSVEVWNDGSLAGGIYGLSIGRVFFGESMFSKVDNASKLAMAGLCSVLVQSGFELLDCQVDSPHLQSMGAKLMDRASFSALLHRACNPPDPARFWPDRCISATQIAKDWK